MPTLEQIVDDLVSNRGLANTIDDARALQTLTEIQRMAFAHNSRAFLNWDNEVTLTQEVDDSYTLGPYEPPANTRSIMGITRYTDKQIYSNLIRSESDYCWPDQDDYQWDSVGRIWEVVRINVLGTLTATWASEPNPDNTYRWVVYVQPEILTDKETDDAKVLIPDNFRTTALFQAAVWYEERIQSGDPVVKEDLKVFFQDFWDYMDSQSLDDQDQYVSKSG